MGPEGRARDLFCSPELSHREDSNSLTQEQYRSHRRRSHVSGQDCLDGQILGQLRPLSEEEESTGATFLGEPAFPEMDSEDLRLASFFDWPSTAGIQPEPLAAAGFFHTAPAHGGPELLASRRETQPEDASEPGAGDVQAQLRQLQEERTCKVCLDRAVSVVFVPCGHLVCTECAPNLQVCPICREPISSCVRTFLS
ncbi:Baculoviral IAP repeat-containing protein 7 [Cricetulus griseus]|uniref:RING-type E3 ubiquitin transferase n=1 Tax=Cricetulus griseus TaxID=10029 RepID=G3HGY0_CRIGR|nr:Baculoviral IAP repeat-containing protein 7 [Cricetulus griseus]